MIRVTEEKTEADHEIRESSREFKREETNKNSSF